MNKEKTKGKGGKLIVFSAPSGSGKTTIVKHLLGIEKLNLEFSVSALHERQEEKKKTAKITIFFPLRNLKTTSKMRTF